MSQPEKQVLGRLGHAGLARVLHDLLDHARLVRLANTCGLRYPGMRTRSQTRERLLRDLVERTEREEAARKAVFRVLRKETSGATRGWSRLSVEERQARLEKVGGASNGQLGLHLFLLAQGHAPGASGDETAEPWLERLLARPDLLPADEDGQQARELAKLRRENTRLKKKGEEQQKKIAHLEEQQAKARETARALKRDATRGKSALDDARARIGKLERELERSRKAELEAAARASGSLDGETLDKLGRGLRKVATEQRKLAHGVEKLTEAASSRPERASAEPPASLVEPLQALQKELAGLRREHRRESREHAGALDALRSDVRSYRSAVAKRFGPARSPRRKGEPERVGVFVDVQNMYYGARQLKGKLDFDALLQAAVRDRRMIQAKAYVVASKEIDQSGFISRLEQRAIEVRTKALQVRADGSMKGDWDMEMAFDILDAAPSLDVVVLVSGDGDFTSLVTRIKRMGPKVEVIGWPRTTAKSLMEAADRFQPLDRNFMIRT